MKNKQRKEELRLKKKLYELYFQRRKHSADFSPTLKIEALGEKEKPGGAKEPGKSKAIEVYKGAKKNKPKVKNTKYKLYVTEINAMDPLDGRIKAYSGPHIVAKNMDEAVLLCQNTGLGYCSVIGELVSMFGDDGVDVKDAYKWN